MPTNRPLGSNAIARYIRTVTHTLRPKTKASKYRFGVLTVFSLFAAPAAVLATQPSPDPSSNREPSMHTEASRSDSAAIHDSASEKVSTKNEHVTSTDVTVNGQQIPIPDNGSSKQHVQNPDGSVVDVTIEHDSSSTSTTSSSYTSLKVDSTTERSANEDG